ncbi:MAG: type IV pilus twitching motility protein PilT [Acidimicrobiia bacterium]
MHDVNQSARVAAASRLSGAAGTLNDFLAKVVELGASDLHLAAGACPTVRLDGNLVALEGTDLLTSEQIQTMVFSVLSQRHRQVFEDQHELDASYSAPNIGRFRVNVFQQKDAVGCVMRAIPFQIVPLQQLGLPPVVGTFATQPRGLVLVTGPTGSGKSTTLASLIDSINETEPFHIMTVEDPVEFVHSHKKSVVNQREVGQDTESFAAALKHVLRQDPDVILVGEMRDLETISIALTAAETGHLVFGTLHTQDAPQAIDRVIDVFPPSQQAQIRVMLATTLQGVVAQQLLPKAIGHGRVCAVEVLVATAAVRNLIREGKTHQIPSAMQAGGQSGMITMDQSLAQLVKDRAITMETAAGCAAHPDELQRMVGSAAVSVAGNWSQ